MIAPAIGATELFARELLWGLRHGGQHRYLVLGLTLGLTLLLLLEIGLAVLQTQVYETVMGQAGGIRIWMDAPLGVAPGKPGNNPMELPASLEDGGALRFYPYTDITERTLAFSGTGGARGAGLRGRLTMPEHPIRSTLQPAAGPRDEVLALGFFRSPESPFFYDKYSVLGESPQAVLYMALRAIPTVDWRAQITRSPALLEPDYRILEKMAGDCWLAGLLRTTAGVRHLYGEGEMPSYVIKDCGKPSTRDYLDTFTDWKDGLAAGGNRRSGLFLAGGNREGDWVRVIWIRDIPLPGRFHYLIAFSLGQALKLQTAATGSTFRSCRVNLGSVYDGIYLRPGDRPLSEEELYECLDPCFEKGNPGCRLETTKYHELKLAGPHLYPAWLAGCPALANRLRDLSPGNRPPAVTQACPGFAVSQVDVYLPRHGTLPEAERLLQAGWGMAPGVEARDILDQVAGLVETLEGVERIGLLAILAYLGVVVVFLQDNLVRQRCGPLGQLRAHGLGDREILAAGAVTDLLSWLLSILFALGVACAVTVSVLDTGQRFEYYAQGLQAAAIWIGFSLLLHLLAGATVHWRQVLRFDPFVNS